MRYAWTPKFQLSGPTIHSYTVILGHPWRVLADNIATRQNTLSDPSVCHYSVTLVCDCRLISASPQGRQRFASNQILQ